MDKVRVAEVVWLDAWVIADETSTAEEAEDNKALVMKDVGFLLSRTKEGVTLASSVSEQDSFRTINFIPAGMIKKVRILK